MNGNHETATMLKCDGNKIVDASGKQVILRGVSDVLDPSH
jgi:hypothetical protein